MRLQLALNVADLTAAIDFYSKMFDVAPAKVRDGYANFVVENPSLKLVLFEGAGADGTINHLGVEVETADQVVDAERRLSNAGLATTGVDDTICCFAEKAETWVHAPDGNRWEWYVKTADAEQIDMVVVGRSDATSAAVSGTCCPAP